MKYHLLVYIFLQLTVSKNCEPADVSIDDLENHLNGMKSKIASLGASLGYQKVIDKDRISDYYNSSSIRASRKYKNINALNIIDMLSKDKKALNGLMIENKDSYEQDYEYEDDADSVNNDLRINNKKSLSETPDYYDTSSISSSRKYKNMNPMNIINKLAKNKDALKDMKIPKQDNDQKEFESNEYKNFLKERSQKRKKIRLSNKTKYYKKKNYEIPSKRRVNKIKSNIRPRMLGYKVYCQGKKNCAAPKQYQKNYEPYKNKKNSYEQVTDEYEVIKFGDRYLKDTYIMNEDDYKKRQIMKDLEQRLADPVYNYKMEKRWRNKPRNSVVSIPF